LPVLRQMAKEHKRFLGLLYAGLMLTKDGPRLLEFNVRFGDPESQALLFAGSADIYPLLYGVAHGQPMDMSFWQEELLDMHPAVAVVLASAGYPGSCSKEEPISLPKTMPVDARLYFAATGIKDSDLMAKSGRVACIVARGPTIEAARALSYELVRDITFFGRQYRSDIGTKVTKLTAV
jgi:phosphoribosylamine--glycine ligase